MEGIIKYAKGEYQGKKVCSVQCMDCLFSFSSEFSSMGVDAENNKFRHPTAEDEWPRLTSPGVVPIFAACSNAGKTFDIPEELTRPIDPLKVRHV